MNVESVRHHPKTENNGIDGLSSHRMFTRKFCPQDRKVTSPHRESALTNTTHVCDYLLVNVSEYIHILSFILADSHAEFGKKSVEDGVYNQP